jgi:N-acetylglutamate synthase-like GNAT family acetyltransferase
MLREPTLADVNSIVAMLKSAAIDGHFLDLDQMNGRQGLLAELCAHGITQKKRPASGGEELACRYWVWELEGTVVGYALFSVIDSRIPTFVFPKRCVELHQFVIDPKYRGRHEGRTFLTALLQCQRYADKDVFARCLPASVGFISLAIQAGFKNLGIARRHSETLIYFERVGASARVKSRLQTAGMI